VHIHARQAAWIVPQAWKSPDLAIVLTAANDAHRRAVRGAAR
jgi:hypothetical protein